MTARTNLTYSGLAKDGFCLFTNVIDQSQRLLLIQHVEKYRNSQSTAGLRNLLGRSEIVREFADSGIAKDLAVDILGSNAFPVRAILFDKTPNSNWYVTWHQDLAIPVKKKD